MRLLGPILLLLSWLAMLTTAMPPRSAKSPKLVDGSIESLKEMVRTKQFKPAILKTLPFETLRSRMMRGSTKDKTSRRSSICGECMATILKLILDTYPPEARPLQQPKWHDVLVPIRKVRWRVVQEWFWSTPDTPRRGRVDTGSLACFCDVLLSALRKPTRQHHQCYAEDFDEELSHIYDPDHRILVIHKDLGTERPRGTSRLESSETTGPQRQENQNFFSSSSQSSSTGNTVKTWLKDARDGVVSGLDRALNAIGNIHRGASSPSTPSPHAQPMTPPIPHGQFITTP